MRLPYATGARHRSRVLVSYTFAGINVGVESASPKRHADLGRVHDALSLDLPRRDSNEA